MKSETLAWTQTRGWTVPANRLQAAQLVLAFGNRDWIAATPALDQLRQTYPGAHIVACSTGGQIVDDDVSDEIGSAMAMQFDHTALTVARVAVAGAEGSFHAGQRLAEALARPDLKGIFILSDGLNVNGSQLVAGLRSIADDQVVITGGLAGDGASFERTLVHLDGESLEGEVVAVGFAGAAMRIGHGSAGGWSEFGPRRSITRSTGNQLFEIDGCSALELYKAYLGEEAEGLPGTGLLYPLLISDPHRPGRSLVRTILAIDKATGSMTFAGDMPEGWTAQLMRGHFDRLAKASAEAATAAMTGLDCGHSDAAAILISCIGRRILMGESIISEVAAARRSLGEKTAMAGFYSYGEISPHAVSGCSEFHNQTMTITTFSEAA
ncbi:MAG: hypothetical protein FD175_2189 [Beijerinckiaceae bacterium]|nr:MAG: hypothetical protein FD175_2189 [Beijerinckiaceae bacterium]